MTALGRAVNSSCASRSRRSRTKDQKGRHAGAKRAPRLPGAASWSWMTTGNVADSLGMLLRMMGNEVHTAHDGLEAVGAAAAFQPDVVLLDLGLPKLNGYETARRIREQDGGTDMMLVAVTGWGQEEDRRRSKEAGFDHHMTKPVEFADLQKLLA